ncbi:N-acetylglucosamine kinase [Pedobacter sp. KR3-3]|uniref:N-acetylglucosamine kinase n=1 Tax=Pedobacter albus TaxID=3113905 RepID=A0ABU7ICY5_9SPHI|nr:N-acetylglucosamine kinase [Pedobacter sp. KR3-3]MEE1947034.1 N-acetylglucosamine kinase [Pedobacter sp. KR3-3]
MILVADSGSSKTDWMAYSPNQILSFSTQGINPYFVNAHDVVKILSKNKEIAPYATAVKEVYFFGSGCSSPDKHEIISNGLSAFFTKAFISVDHDLIGSAYATCGDKKGLACILGTGSNISYYDGQNVHDGKHGLGYVLGDEGSGTYFGKKILLSFLYQTMPADLCEAFAKAYEVNKDIVIENIYQKPLPNSYLAGFSRFMKAHQSHPFIQQVLHDGFQEFIDTNVKDYKSYRSLECNFVGSIAYYYQDELRATFVANNIKVGKILQKPIEGIFDYILKREGITLQMS